VNKIKIKDIRQTKASSIVMEFDTRSDLLKFKDHPKLETFQIKEESKKKNPFLILYDMDSLLTVSERKYCTRELRRRTLHRERWYDPKIQDRTKIVDRMTHWVLQVVSKETYTKIRKPVIHGIFFAQSKISYWSRDA